MPMRVVEFGGYASGRPFSANAIPTLPPIQVQNITIGSSVSTNVLSSATRMILVDSDAGATIFIGSSVSTGVASSSACMRIGANLPMQPFFVAPFSRLCTLST